MYIYMKKYIKIWDIYFLLYNQIHRKIMMCVNYISREQDKGSYKI